MNLDDMSVVLNRQTKFENAFLIDGDAIDVSVDFGIVSSGSSQRVSLDYDYKASLVEAQVDSYQTVYVYDENRLQSYRVVKAKGSDGILANTYSLTYRQNHLVERKLASSDTVLERVDEVIVIGTRKQSAPGVFTNSLMWPLYYDEAPVITSYYGSYRPQFDANGYHRGLDIYLPMRSDILAAEGGIVTTVDRTPSYGIRIIIDHDGTNFQTLYAHLDQALVKKGDKVYAGQLIAKSGATGNVTGPHLHFEVRANMRYKNPMNYLPDYKK
jgi:murein DD-endopeptidase MepM/ murein hydrolase activator NlpD